MRRTLAPISSIALLLALSGCNVGPDYKAPEAPMPNAYHEPLAGGLTSGPASLQNWWKSLNDAALDQLITQSIEQNLDLRLAGERLREARAQRGVVAADGLPQVNADGNYARRRDSQNNQSGRFGSNNGNFDDSYDTFQAGFDASWEIDVFGSIRRGVEAADADIAAAAEARRDVLVTVTSEVARNYIDLRSLQARLAIAQKNVGIQQDSLDLAQSRFDAGLTSELDVARAKAQLQTIQAAIPRLEQQIHQSLNRLAVLLGKQPGAVSQQLATATPVPPLPPEVPIGLPSELLRRRPDIRRAERLLAAATARIGQAEADFLPRFSLTGTFGLSSDRIGEFADSDSRFWSIGPSFRWPIFQGGRLKSNLEVRNAQQAQALTTFEQTLLTSLEDVENTLASYAREQVRNQSLAQAVAADKRAVELANEQYSRGLEDFSAVIDAQRQLFIVEDELAQSTGQLTLNLISLYKSLGGGWENWLPEHQSPENATPPASKPPASSPATGESTAPVAIATPHRLLFIDQAATGV
jgi:outer membrane protein, multidrug efflux system